MAHNTFDDGAAYELLMGRWTRAVGAIFLEWVDPPKDASWLDVGCGTGIFTELVVEMCAPTTVVANDPSAAQIELARNKPFARMIDFRVADAQMLPFADNSFDIVASALVINFISDRAGAMTEMRRVARPSGVVAGYVWDFAKDLSPTGPVRNGLNQIGIKTPLVSGTEDSRLEALSALFSAAGLQGVATRTIDVTMSFPSFNDFWQTQKASYSPTGKVIAALSETDREKLIEAVRASLPASRDGSVAYSARANAIKAHVPS